MRIGHGKTLSVFVVAVIAVGFLFVKPGAEAASSVAVFHATLTGAAEVPGPGDPDGKGDATIVIRPAKGTVCFSLSTRRIGDPHLAHIHRGTADVFGPVVVTLVPPDPTSSGCVRHLDRELLEEIAGNPAGFYVNVHNEEFMAGALRGQLHD